VLFYSVCYIYLLSLKEDLVPLRSQPMFWFNVGVLLYFTGTFFLYLLSNNTVYRMPRSLSMLTWACHGMVLIVYHVFITVALWSRREV
jgi:hypothetical protein